MKKHGIKLKVRAAEDGTRVKLTVPVNIILQLRYFLEHVMDYTNRYAGMEELLNVLDDAYNEGKLDV